MSDVSPLSGISGLSIDSTLLSHLFFFCLVLLFFLSYLFCSFWPILLNFVKKNLQYCSLTDRRFCTAPVQQLVEVSWSVVCAACCHMVLVFAVIHLYVLFSLLLCIPFLIPYLDLVMINRRNGPRYQRVQALCAFFFFKQGQYRRD